MSHVLTLALVYALSLEAVHLLHAAASGWAAERRLPLAAAALAAGTTAAVVGVVLAADRLTAALPPNVLLAALVWLAAALALALALWLHEQRRAGRRWRAMAANAPALIAGGLPFAVWPPAVLGLALAALAGWLAPPPSAVDWLPFAALALFVTGRPARPHGWAVRSVLLAWLAGGAIAALETLIDPASHLLAIALAGLLALRLAAAPGRRLPAA